MKSFSCKAKKRGYDSLMRTFQKGERFMLKILLALLFLFGCYGVQAQENEDQNQDVEVSQPEQEEENLEARVEELTLNLESQVGRWSLNDVETLKRANFDFAQKDVLNNPILYYALSQNPDIEVIKKIIEYGADVNAAAQNGMLPINVCTSKANEIQLKLLMMKTMGFDMGEPEVEAELEKRVFFEMSKMTELTAFLIDNGADINKESPLGTPLMNAVTNKWNTDIVALLIKYGAKINKRDRDGRTALFYAFSSGNDDLVTMLIKAGADTEIKDKNGQTYLELERPKFD